MRLKSVFAGVAALSLSVAAFAQAPATAPAFTPEAFRSHVTFLADDLLEGREAGTRGYDIAARYVATQFAGLGLQPAGPGGSYFQQVPFVRYLPGSQPTLTVGNRSFTGGEGFSARASADPQTLSVPATPAVFVGYGLDLPGQGHDDYRGQNVRGKVVVAFSGLPAGLASDVAAHLNSEKRRMAAQRGAVGLILIPGSDAMARAAHARGAMQNARPGTTWVDPRGMPYSDADGLRFVLNAGPELATALFDGAPRTLEQVQRSAMQPGAAERGFALRQTVGFQRPGAQLTRFDSPNVVAVLPGSDPALANEYVVLTGHLDGVGVIPEGTPGAGDDRIRNGAMDNATGIASMLEVARQLVASGQRPRRPILFAALTAEEKGLLGASYLARNPVVNGRIVGLVNLDMPVLTYNFSDVIAFGAEHSTLGPIVERAARSMGITVTPDPLPQEGLFTRSDHYMFVRAGVPSVFLMTGFAGEGQERFTSFLRGPYHGPGDDLSLPFNWGAGAKFAELNYRILREIADGDQAPLWYADSFFGRSLGGQAPRATRPQPSAPGAAR